MILPAAVFLLAAGGRAVWLTKSSNKVTHSPSRSIKLVLLSAFTAVQFTILLGRATDRPASVTAAALDFAAALVLFILSCFEHSRSVTPSTIIGLYLLVSLLFDAVRLRTLFLLHDRLAHSLALSLAVKTTVLITEAVEKRAILLNPYRNLPPESTSGIYNKSVFWWLNSLLFLGFNKTLKVDDLFTLDPALASANVHRRFHTAWTAVKEHSRFSLIWVTFRVLKWQLLVSAIPRLLLTATTLTQPFLIQATITFISDRNQPASTGWSLAAAYFLISFAEAMLRPAFEHLLNRCTTQVRGGLIALLYEKTLDISISATDPSASLTLMSADIQRITDTTVLFHDTWCSFIDIGIGMYLLYLRMGSACYAPAIVYVIQMIGTAWIVRIISDFQRRWLDAVQKRVSFTSGLLHSMRNIKLLGMSSIVEEKTQNLRSEEIEQCKRFRVINNFRIVIGLSASVCSPFAAFLVYYLQAGGTLDIASAFSVLTILRVVESPINVVVYAATTTASALSCFERIQTYLLSESRHDNRLSLSDIYDSEGYWNSSTGESMEMRRLGSVSQSPADDAVVLKKCSFGWERYPIVKDIDLSLRAGSFTMIIGPVGCGKSTLLKGILSETALSQGFVYLRNDSIAFADQEAWIQNGTISESVCPPSSNYDEQWYREVVQCCGLSQDIEVFPKGDLTPIGSKGISLSGGQKQRLALARAVYCKADLLVLDDIFSGLDNDTEDLIFRNLFGRYGPIKRFKTTVLMVTHAVHRLPHADLIMTLNEHGRISEQGNYTTLMSSDGYVRGLEVRMKQYVEIEGEHPPSAAKPPTQTAIEDEGTEDLLRRTGEWKTYKHYFRSSGYVPSVLSMFFTTLYVLSIQMPGILVNHFSSNSSSATLFTSILGISAAMGLFGLTTMSYTVFMIMQPRSASGLHLKMLQTVLNAPLSFFTRTDIGSITNRFSQDMSLVDSDLPFAYVSCGLEAILCIFGIGLMAASSGFFAAAVPVVVAALYMIQKYYLRTSRQIRLLDLEEKAPLYTMFAETAAGLASIRAFGWSSKFAARHLELLDRSQRPFYLLRCIQRWLSLVLDLMVSAMIAILMIIVVSKRDSIDPGLVGLGLLSTISLNSALTDVVKQWTNLETSIGAISRICEFVQTTVSEHKPQESDIVPSQWPARGDVRFEAFAASYSEDSALVLKNIEIELNSGEKIGICGRSGSGKSSMLSSVFHMLEFRTGSIQIDGKNIAFIPRETLRSRLNVIPQEPWWVTTESVRFNMDPWNASNGSFNTPLERDEEDAKFITALSRCHIWHIIQKRGGLDAAMTVDFLSHGQRQLFCLARALIRRSKVVVLDEISANVDIKTDALMQQVIREHFADCTVISVAHRLNTIDDSDRVVVLGQGRVVEVGEPQALLKTDRSRFRELYET